MIRNNKGLATTVTVALYALAAMILIPTVETAKNGVLKSNGQRIWCKMQNKGAEYCDATYSIK